jgi:hypothetical protein
MIPGAPIWAQILLALVGAGSLGGLVVKGIDRWLTFRQSSRKQTDDMALRSNAQWEARVVEVERACTLLRAEMKAERETCERQLSELRHSLANEVMSWEALATGIRFRPESAAEVLEHVEQLRTRRRAEAMEDRRLRLAEARHAERGALREGGQLIASGVHVAEAVERAAAA